MTSARVSPCAPTSDSPPVYVRKIVGIRTLTAPSVMGTRSFAGRPPDPSAGSPAGQTCLGEGGVGRFDGSRGTYPVRNGVEGLQTVPGVEHHGLRVGVQLPGLHELLQGGHGDPAGGLRENALGAGQ